MIIAYENLLKKLIIEVIGASDDTDYKIDADVKEQWLTKRKLEKEKNDDALLDKRLIHFADFFDLKIIINKNWDKFESILKNKERFLVFFDEVNQYRNALHHGQSLTKSQEALLAGITNDLKNNYTIHQNKMNSRNDHFVLINSISDNLGYCWNNQSEENATKPTLKVNDEYELLVDANDPKDREITYEVYHFAGSFRVKQKENRFTFTITKDLVGLNTLLVVKAFTPKSDYKNESVFKINITVIPE